MEQVVVGPPGSNDQVQSSVQLSPEAKNSIKSPAGSSDLDARRYSRTKMWLGLSGTIFFFCLTFVFVISGLSQELDAFIRGFIPNDYLALLVFVTVAGIAETILSFPLSYYSGFRLEHKYHLSNQSFVAWITESLKGMAVSIPIALPILLLFFYCLKAFATLWWLPVGGVLFLVTVVLARLAPVLIFPLFYKFVPLQEGTLKDTILSLCARVGVAVEGVFTFDLSKNTKKANAAFTGVGRSKRIILGDTLVQNFSEEEIESVFAHELGHYTMKHIWSMMAIGTFNSFLGLFLTAQCYSASLSWFGFDRPDQISALPLLTLWLGLYSLVTSPLGNYVSRKHEYAADRFAVKTSANKEGMMNALRKLAVMNLAETTPPPIVEFMFHSHPSIEKRLKAIDGLNQ
jgi:STE24 endopeptidase